MASTLAPGWWAVTKLRNTSGELIGSPDELFRRSVPVPVPVPDCAGAVPRDVDFLAGRLRAGAGSVVGSVAALEREAPRPPDAALRVRRPAPVVPAVAVALRASLLFASRKERRLTAPFTGTRGTKTQPTPGTGLPPQRRSSSNSHG